MSWLPVCYVAIATLSTTIAVIYLAAWFMQRKEWSYLAFAVLALSIAALAVTELRLLQAQTPDEYATALRWLHVPVWSGFVALLGLVYLRLKPRFAWVGKLAAALRTASLVANFVTGANINYRAVTGIEHVIFLGEPLAVARGSPNPWMITAQAALLLSVIFLLDCGINAWRRGDRVRSLVLSISLLAAILLGGIQAILVYWGFVQMPVVLTPLFLVVATLMGIEVSFGLSRAAQAERDVELKDAALSLSKQRLNLAAEAANAGFWSLDRQSGEIWATSKARELLALAPGGDIYLADVLNRVHMRDRAWLEQKIWMTSGSDDGYRAEFRIVDAGGEVRWLGVIGRDVHTTSGEPRTLMGVAVDITAQRALQDEISQQRARLDLMSKTTTLAGLSTAIAHELNQPLATILTNAEAAQTLLAEKRPNLRTVKQILADIVSADLRAAGVIRHLRSLAERGEPRREALSIHDTIHQVLRLLASEIDGRGITVDLDLAPGLPSVQADAVLVQQVLLNLLDNACNAVVDKPAGERQLSLVTRTQGDAVLLEVTDNGSGLADPNRAFEPFYSTRPDGLGMGLTIVRSIVNSHGGRVSIESSPGRGTTTSVSLPINGAAP